MQKENHSRQPVGRSQETVKGIYRDEK